MDIFTPKKRSEVMSKIRGKDTKPEMILRKALYAKGFRYRLYGKLPGKPDIVLRKYKTVIFVNGCFWHGHEGCKYATRPKSNTEFWQSKIQANQRRDALHTLQLEANGWNVLTVWECEIVHQRDLEPLLERIIMSMRAQLDSPRKVDNYRYPTYEEAMLVVAEAGDSDFLPDSTS